MMTDALRQGGAPFPRSAAGDFEVPPEDGAGDDFKPLSRVEAEVLRSRLAVLSPWRVIAVQAAAGVLCVAVAGLAGDGRLAASALYGMGAVVLPQIVLARGVTRPRSGGAVSAAFGFLIWELAKIGLAVAMLAAAGKVVNNLSWPALLVTMVVCMKVSWLALLWQRAPAAKNTTTTRTGEGLIRWLPKRRPTTPKRS